MARTITVIINPVSGGASPSTIAARVNLAKRIIADAGADADVLVTEGRGHARPLASEAVARGTERVCAWGGDGTLNEVASALAFTDVPLGIIPAGSGNGLARELGIATRPERALRDAIALPPRAIDLGEIDGRLFINIAGIGFDAHIASLFNAPSNARRGFGAYARLAAAALLRYAPDEYVLDTGGRRRSVRAFLLTVANSAQWGNNARIAPGARVDDGELDLVVIEDASRPVLLWHLPRLFTGTVARMPACSIDRVREMTIESSRAIPFHVDGEPVMGGIRLNVRVRPGALLVCTPASVALPGPG